MTVTSSGYSLGLRAKWSAMRMARSICFAATALHSSKLLYSFDMPTYCSMWASVMDPVPAGSASSSLSTSFDIFDMSHPIWSVSICTALASIFSPREAMNEVSHGPIS